MKVLYELLCQFIDNMFIMKELLKNKKLMCEEYSKSMLKLNTIKKEQKIIMRNICNRLNFKFKIKPNWHRKGFIMNKRVLFYGIILPKIDYNSKEYYCLEYMLENLQKKYYDDMIISFSREGILIENVLEGYNIDK